MPPTPIPVCPVLVVDIHQGGRPHANVMPIGGSSIDMATSSGTEVER
jgi:hypothetical protein